MTNQQAAVGQDTVEATRSRRTESAGPEGVRMGRVLSTVVRLGLAVLWLAAGLFKIGDPQGMVRSVRAFRILPEPLVHPVAYAVPFVEITLGLLLLAGLAVRVSAAVSALLLAAYITAIASAAARGLRIDCGCFSSGGDLTAGAPTHYTGEIVRDSLLLVASALLVRLPAGALTVDRLLEQGPHPQAAEGPKAAQS
ncbi:DoxX family protein [Candidatus Protofrankia californiensis]|uniref:DoxX family protein n=1 Tax=Candidatus Protofrankia californiensis TaxID=1839754 RepID=A0A1C3NWM1_9ACTN|nr:DoxX family protein [Candidatus Protofrankia californiensis]